MLDAGELDRRIVIERAALVEDDYGDLVEAFVPLQTVWASVRPSPGRERLQSAENAAAALLVIRIRHWSGVADVSPKDWIEYPLGSGKRFNIVTVTEIGRREGLELAVTGRAD